MINEITGTTVIRAENVITGKKVITGKNVITGGKVVNSGGFGCIFKPALKCVNNIDNTTNDINRSYIINQGNKEQISKLMIAKNAVDEFNQIKQFQSVLKVIPNYENYFLLNNFTLCTPAKLTKTDTVSFDKKCKALTKKNIKVKNLNKNLPKLLALNMPDAGIDIEKYIDTNFVSSRQIIELNNALIKLLIKGIVPMNNLNVFHCDIKDSNVLVDSSDSLLTTRLIDWGLSIIKQKHTNTNTNTNKNINEENTSFKIPKKLYRRPFQYNVPFSSILFNKEFVKYYDNFLKINPNPSYFQIREFTINYIFIWNNIRGPGHLDTINDIIKSLTFKELIEIKKKGVKAHIIEYEFTYYYIVEYLSKILEKYTSNGYFKEKN
jgi:serine/threonine protein kinase